jgi:DNA invertase Pin-like site-specific DNA recombinase
MAQPQTVAYLRVSTTDQDLGKNKADILHLANEADLGRVKWIEERVSSRVPWQKRKVAQILADLQPGDNLIVSELSRLGRSMLECMEILSIATQKQINVYAVKGNWHLGCTNDLLVNFRLIWMTHSPQMNVATTACGICRRNHDT